MNTKTKTLEERVTNTIADQLGLEASEIQPGHTFTELGGDSLDRVELSMAIEDEFDVDFTDQDTEACTTVQNYIDMTRCYVDRKAAR